MPAALIHLVRHGEVHNPDRVLYGRIPGFHLSELGHRMAAAATGHLAGHAVDAVYSSPLQRAQESAAPWATNFGLDLQTDERLIEPTNKFEGDVPRFGLALLSKPAVWPWIIDPFRPSWGEPYLEVAARVIAAVDDAWEKADAGEVVMVSHQMPIVMFQRSVAGRRLWHDPRQRRCSLSSITSFERVADAASGRPRYREVGYVEPAAGLLEAAVDLGAV